MLTKNKYLPVYRSFFNNFDIDFMNPSYSESNKLNRGSGYFSLRSLILSIDGLIRFIKNDGYINLICNPELSNEDIEKIDAGLSISIEDISKDLLEKVENEILSEDIDKLKMDIVCNMISAGRLKIKIAYMPNGIYHEKFGTFFDNEGNMVYFNGSANETYNAKRRNFESFFVTTSWTGDVEAIIEECEYFDKLWNNEVEGLVVYDFPDAIKEKIFTKYKSSSSLGVAIKNYINRDEDHKKELYSYQETAIKEFFDNEFAHFYEMATGTGKTFTSVKTIEKLIEKKGKIFVLICVPQIDLQSQWQEALNENGYSKVYLFGGENNSKLTETDINNSIIDYMINDQSAFCISIYDTFFSKFYSICDNIDNLFIIFDEAHNLSENQIAKLPKNVKYKLGLSATIQRFNAKETDKIIEYFTNNTIKPYFYGIEDAIKNGFLSRYEYHPIFVNIGTDDYEKYKKKNIFLATLLNAEIKDHDAITKARRERNLIIKQANCKISLLESMIGKYEFKNSVVYCGQGKDEEESIIDIVSNILGRKGHYDVSQFTSKTVDRKSVLKEFEHNYYDTLVAIKCLDEGVDIPKLDKIYIMASDSSLKQTIQRRGRVLRKCKETGKQKAFIYDMVVLPPEDCYDSSAKSLIITEFKRAQEYCRLAVNKDDVVRDLNYYLDIYGVTEEELYNEE